MLEQSKLPRLDSEWIGDSNMRVRVREINGTRRVILVDVIELSPKTTSKARALKIARKFARLHSIVSGDAVMISDIGYDKKGVRLSDGAKVLTHVRATTWYFEGV